MENIFIDTNIFLSFYHYSNDDLEELKKLSLFIDQRRIKLYIPSQIVDEFDRNREIKISDALNKFKDEKLSNQFPQICKEYEEYKPLKDALKTYQSLKSVLLDKLLKDIKSNNLKADKIINELFAKSEIIELTEEIISKSKLRYDRGNPPGKNGSYGDAINWECLIQDIQNNTTLYFISDDKDYYSSIDNNEFSPYLKKEWKNKKESDIVYYKRLSSLFKDHYPTINLNDEIEKDRLINELLGSPNFAHTRQTLRQLIKYSGFSDLQINDIVYATITNNQVYWIADDEDINGYLRKIVEGYNSVIIPEHLATFKRLVFPKNEAAESTIKNDDDFPF